MLTVPTYNNYYLYFSNKEWPISQSILLLSLFIQSSNFYKTSTSTTRSTKNITSKPRREKPGWRLQLSLWQRRCSGCRSTGRPSPDGQHCQLGSRACGAGPSRSRELRGLHFHAPWRILELTIIYLSRDIIRLWLSLLLGFYFSGTQSRNILVGKYYFFYFELSSVHLDNVLLLTISMN